MISGTSFLRLLSSRVTGGTRRLYRTGAIIVATQVSATVVLAVGAGLMGRSLVRMVNADLGFETDGVFSFRIDVPEDPYASREQVFQLASEIVTAFEAQPGKEFASIWTPRRPGEVSGGARLYPEDQPDLLPEDVTVSKYHQVTPGALTSLGIPIVQGRDFNSSDGPESVPVMIVSRRLAERLWPDENPIGKRIRHFTTTGQATPETPFHEVVGVAEDVLMGGLIELGGRTIRCRCLLSTGTTLSPNKGVRCSRWRPRDDRRRSPNDDFRYRLRVFPSIHLRTSPTCSPLNAACKQPFYNSLQSSEQLHYCSPASGSMVSSPRWSVNGVGKSH